MIFFFFCPSRVYTGLHVLCTGRGMGVSIDRYRVNRSIIQVLRRLSADIIRITAYHNPHLLGLLHTGIVAGLSVARNHEMPAENQTFENDRGLWHSITEPARLYASNTQQALNYQVPILGLMDILHFRHAFEAPFLIQKENTISREKRTIF